MSNLSNTANAADLSSSDATSTSASPSGANDHDSDDSDCFDENLAQKPEQAVIPEEDPDTVIGEGLDFVKHSEIPALKTEFSWRGD
jgi:hypothetical protein